jgi:hypothetical protein
MFGKRKNKVTSTLQDRKIKNLQADRYDAWKEVERRAEQVLIRNGAIEMYPEGADKEKAKKDAESAKRILISAVAVYDDLCNQYKKAFEEPFERVTTKDYKCICKPSHEIIEDCYKNFYKRG